MEHITNNLTLDLADADTDRVSRAAGIAKGISRGTGRLLRDLGYEVLEEFKLASRRRVDLAGLDRKGRFAVVEIKSSLADFRADTKWPEYLAHCDFFYFAVADDFPLEALPDAEGLIIADAYDAAIQRPAAERPMNGNRRRSQLLRFARQSAQRLAQVRDPARR